MRGHHKFVMVLGGFKEVSAGRCRIWRIWELSATLALATRNKASFTAGRAARIRGLFRVGQTRFVSKTRTALRPDRTTGSCP